MEDKRIKMIKELLTPDISKVTDSMSVFDKVMTINTQSYSLILIGSILIITLFVAILMGLMLKAGKKRLVEQGNFWLLTLGMLLTEAILLAFLYYLPLPLLLIN